MAICHPCLGLPCINPDDLAAGIDGALYSALDYSFIVQCPPLCFCPPGLFPQTISILASTIPPVIPPIIQPGFPIVLRLQGCSAIITRTLDSGSTQAQITAAAQSMQAEWAGQQALCNATSVPGVNCNTGSGFIDVCNDARSICCPGFGPIFINAGLYCQKLNITGMSPDQVAAATAALKLNLNTLSIDNRCPAFGTFCSIIETIKPVGGAEVITLGHNQSATNAFDSSSFQYCDINGNVIFNSFINSIAPSTTGIICDFSGPIGPNPFLIKYQGLVVFTDPNFSVGHDRQVDFFVNCGLPPATC